MKVTCPHCATVYRIDPQKVPEQGVQARCAHCPGVFFVARQDDQTNTRPEEGDFTTAGTAPRQSEESVTHAPATATQPAPGTATSAAPAAAPARPATPPSFGRPDPDAKARRLARALISDIVVYHPERRDRSIAEGTLRQEFREEIRKSWDEYVAQVGTETARSSPHFRDALNEILAAGRNVF